MFTALIASSLARIRAATADTEDGPFACPECGEEVILKAGAIIANHFAHKAESACGFSTGEGCAHHEAKMQIFNALRGRADVSEAAIERRMGQSRADVYAVIGGAPVAIEVQRSYLSLDEVEERTARYAAQSVAAVWVLLRDTVPRAPEYVPNAIERWLHETYGCVYYWHAGDSVWRVQFQPHQLVDRDDRYGAFSNILYITQDVAKPALVAIGRGCAPWRMKRRSEWWRADYERYRQCRKFAPGEVAPDMVFTAAKDMEFVNGSWARTLWMRRGETAAWQMPTRDDLEYIKKQAELGIEYVTINWRGSKRFVLRADLVEGKP